MPMFSVILSPIQEYKFKIILLMFSSSKFMISFFYLNILSIWDFFQSKEWSGELALLFFQTSRRLFNLIE